MIQKKIRKFRNRLILLYLTGAISLLSTDISENKKSIIIDKNLQDTYFSNVDNEKLKHILTEISKIDIDYKYDEYYLTDEEIEELLNEKTTRIKHKPFDGDISYLVKEINDNSVEYLKKHKDYYSLYEYLKNNQNIDFDKTMTDIIFNIIENASNDLDEDLCHMKTLKVVLEKKENEGAVAYYVPSENLIVINEKNIIEQTETSPNRNYEENLTDVMYHELNHLRQITCECDTNDKSNILSYYDNRVSTLIESTAESEVYNNQRYKEKELYKNSVTYKDQRAQESLLLLMALGKSDDINEYYNSFFDTDVQQLYDFFDINNIDDCEAFYNIMYSIDATNKKNNLGNFLYDKENNNPLTNNKVSYDIGFDYKIEIFKRFIENMINYTESDDSFSLEENLVLLAVAKDLVVANSYLIESDDAFNVTSYQKKYSRDFVNDVILLENCYVDYLSMHYNISKDDIRFIEYERTEKNLINLMDVCALSKISTYNEYQNISKNIVKRFPLIRQILFSAGKIQFEYERFLKNNDIYNLKTKELTK